MAFFFSPLQIHVISSDTLSTSLGNLWWVQICTVEQGSSDCRLYPRKPCRPPPRAATIPDSTPARRRAEPAAEIANTAREQRQPSQSCLCLHWTPSRLFPPRLSLMLCTESACSQLSPDQRAKGTKGWRLCIAFLKCRGQGMGVPPAQARTYLLLKAQARPLPKARPSSSHSGGV